MESSLNDLVKNLEPNQFRILQKVFPEKWTHLLRKGVFPYVWLNNPARFDEINLPPKDSFFSEISNEHITDEDYEYAKKIWNLFEMNNFGEYHDLYLKTDVILLADVYENFREIC